MPWQGKSLALRCLSEHIAFAVVAASRFAEAIAWTDKITLFIFPALAMQRPVRALSASARSPARIPACVQKLRCELIEFRTSRNRVGAIRKFFTSSVATALPF